MTRTLDQIEEIIIDNVKNGRHSFDGLTAEEGRRRNHAAMYGENDEAFNYDDVEAWTR